jgi:Tol biopolymer transport system component
VARRDESVTRGYQIYLVDPLTGEAQQVTSDPRYSNMFFWWDATGRNLVIHRFPELDENMQPNYTGLPEIWMLDIETLEMSQVAENAFLPRWIP